ncbi:MAG: CcoQ/FixQ family Cbb3-type cytochrome c oxidase assembly chaperone [Mariprofundales bacterium]|nr:CcoQ/FixQ family Cbb3-type cytochrome c oxidase assembly chaperone [Mariprofundales bacterium]
MNSIQEFFSSDWEAMTRTDWTGLIIVLVLTLLMTALYSWVFRPRNRDNFEQYRDFVNHTDDNWAEEANHGQTK